MKTFLTQLIPQIQRYSQSLDNLSLLTNIHWVSLGEIDNGKTVYIFRNNNVLLIAKDGVVSRGSWEYLGNESLLFETNMYTLLLKHSFIDDDILMLKLDGAEGYVHFVNETKFRDEVNSAADVIRFLEKKYFSESSYEEQKHINSGVVPSYREFKPARTNNLFFGEHDVIKIEFIDGYAGQIHRGHSSGRYFIYDSVAGKRYTDTKADCIEKLYKLLKFNM